MLDLVGKFFSDLIFGWQNMASIDDFGIKRLPNFYMFCPACVDVVTIKSLNAVYYEST